MLRMSTFGGNVVANIVVLLLCIVQCLSCCVQVLCMPLFGVKYGCAGALSACHNVMM